MSPAEVGLPERPRRRTPGLRRAELATLAGISIDYLIRLEQGRDTHPSTQVLAALAEALRLSDDDRDHLRNLAAISNGTELCPQARAAARAVRPTVRALLDQLEPSPAFVVNHLADLLAWTEGNERLARPLGILDGEEPNLLQFTFADERARAAYPDWDARAPRCRPPAAGGLPPGRRGDVGGARSARWSPGWPAIRERRLEERFDLVRVLFGEGIRIPSAASSTRRPGVSMILVPSPLAWDRSPGDLIVTMRQLRGRNVAVYLGAAERNSLSWRPRYDAALAARTHKAGGDRRTWGSAGR
ncbi:MAG: helix-turn-helix transcriptional regulator [Pseudonocardiaceae bacterium]